MKMYINFKTNLPEYSKKLATVEVENITFEAKNGDEIEVSLDGEGQFGVEDGRYDARFKGLEISVEDCASGETKRYGGDDVVPKKVLSTFKQMKPSSISFYYEDDGYYALPENDEEIECDDVKIVIEDNEGNIAGEWHVESLEAA